jgi:hypothetical protein
MRDELLRDGVWRIRDDRVDIEQVTTRQKIAAAIQIGGLDVMPVFLKGADHIARAGGRLPDMQSSWQVGHECRRDPLRSLVSIARLAFVSARTLAHSFVPTCLCARIRGFACDRVPVDSR